MLRAVVPIHRLRMMLYSELVAASAAKVDKIVQQTYSTPEEAFSHLQQFAESLANDNEFSAVRINKQKLFREELITLREKAYDPTMIKLLLTMFKS